MFTEKAIRKRKCRKCEGDIPPGAMCLVNVVINGRQIAPHGIPKMVDDKQTFCAKCGKEIVSEALQTAQTNAARLWEELSVC